MQEQGRGWSIPWLRQAIEWRGTQQGWDQQHPQHPRTHARSGHGTRKWTAGSRSESAGSSTKAHGQRRKQTRPCESQSCNITPARANKHKQTQANTSKHKQTQANTSKHKQANTSKQTQTSVASCAEMRNVSRVIVMNAAVGVTVRYTMLRNVSSSSFHDERCVPVVPSKGESPNNKNGNQSAHITSHHITPHSKP